MSDDPTEDRTDDLKTMVLQAVSSLAGTEATGGGRAAGATAVGATSDLTIDETLLVHSIGWEPLDLVCGASVASVPYGVWNWGNGEIGAASAAYDLAVRGAEQRIRFQCTEAGGYGVVGVEVEVEVSPHHIDVSLIGTAVRPVGAKKTGRAPFVSDLSARDFTLLESAGWQPVGLACGASFVYAPRRAAGTALRQASQNVELTNFTEAMYSARSAAIERMQRAATDMGGQGIVEVKVTEGPVSFSRHAVGFTAWGTAVRLEAEAHRHLQPQVVLPLDDAVVQFAAGALRGD